MGIANSILPPEWEAKRVAIARKHNQLVIVMILGLFLVVLLLATLSWGHFPKSLAIGILLALGVAEGYAIFRIIRYDDEMCRRLGFVCPHCRKPLYEPRSLLYRNGLCPKCRKSILS